MKIGAYSAGITWPCAIAGMVAVTVLTVSGTAAIAVEVNVEDYPIVQGVRFGQIANEFGNEFFGNNPDYYGNRNFTGQLRRIFGPFPENTIERDAKNVHDLYLRTQFQQMNAGPILRTLDLPSPFQYSLRTLPPPVVIAPVEVVPPTVYPVPVAPPSASPVPALW